MIGVFAFAGEGDIPIFAVEIDLEFIALGGGVDLVGGGGIPDEEQRAKVELVHRILHLIAISDAVVVFTEDAFEGVAVAGEHDGGEETDRQQNDQQGSETDPQFMPQADHRGPRIASSSGTGYWNRRRESTPPYGGSEWKRPPEARGSFQWFPGAPDRRRRKRDRN